MTLPPEVRRQVHELVARYMLEPTLRDVFVEGSFDADMIRDWARARRLPGVTAYEIATVNVPAEAVSSACPWESLGNRGRVVALAYSLAGSCAGARATCLVDADYDHLRGCQNAFPWPSNLIATDGACSEAYFVDANGIGRVVAALGVPTPSEACVRDMLAALRVVFAHRVAAQDFAFRESLSPFEKLCSIAHGDFAFDAEAFFERCLHKNMMHHKADAIRDRVRHLMSVSLEHEWLQINGHDVCAALALYARAHGRQHVTDKDVCAAVREAADWHSVASQPMFARLEDRLCAA